MRSAALALTLFLSASACVEPLAVEDERPAAKEEADSGAIRGRLVFVDGDERLTVATLDGSRNSTLDPRE